MRESKEKGKVKWFSDRKGFGFINRLDDTVDIFVHYSQISQKGFKTLAQGDEVEFSLFETANGLQAHDVKKIAAK